MNYYLNGRAASSQDDIIFNPLITDIYNEEGNLVVEPVLVNWREVDTKPAFYIFAFSNSKFYAGGSANMLRTLTTHYKEFENEESMDWHKEIGDLIREKSFVNNKGFKYNFVSTIRIFIHYTHCAATANQAKNDWLNKIKRGGTTSQYYNDFIETPTLVKTTFNLLEEQLKTAFKKEKPPQFVLPSRSLSELIDEKIAALPSVGNIIIKFPDDETLTFKSTVPRQQLRRMLLQLTKPNISTYSNNSIKRKKEENGKPFNLSELEFSIDNSTSYNLKKQQRQTLSDIPTCAGTYILMFPNGVPFIGTTKNLRRRITEHINNLFNQNTGGWYSLCRSDHSGELSFENIEISWFKGYEKEKELREKYGVVYG